MPSDPTAEQVELRRKGRQRLIGAVALALVAVVFVPMLLDPEPRRERVEPLLAIPPKEGAPPLPAVARVAEPVAAPEPAKAATPQAPSPAVPAAPSKHAPARKTVEPKASEFKAPATRPASEKPVASPVPPAAEARRLRRPGRRLQGRGEARAGPRQGRGRAPGPLHGADRRRLRGAHAASRGAVPDAGGGGQGRGPAEGRRARRPRGAAPVRGLRPRPPAPMSREPGGPQARAKRLHYRGVTSPGLKDA